MTDDGVLFKVEREVLDAPIGPHAAITGWIPESVLVVDVSRDRPRTVVAHVRTLSEAGPPRSSLPLFELPTTPRMLAAAWNGERAVVAVALTNGQCVVAFVEPDPDREPSGIPRLSGEPLLLPTADHVVAVEATAEAGSIHVVAVDSMPSPAMSLRRLYVPPDPEPRLGIPTDRSNPPRGLAVVGNVVGVVASQNRVDFFDASEDWRLLGRHVVSERGLANRALAASGGRFVVAMRDDFDHSLAHIDPETGLTGSASEPAPATRLSLLSVYGAPDVLLAVRHDPASTMVRVDLLDPDLQIGHEPVVEMAHGDVSALAGAASTPPVTVLLLPSGNVIEIRRCGG
ncbi:MAG: hypothetical protein RMK74_13510 [Myxococcales bacterium]|nr:hypothetical protein [Myxococcales bacterium]